MGFQPAGRTVDVGKRKHVRRVQEALGVGVQVLRGGGLLAELDVGIAGAFLNALGACPKLVTGLCL